VVSEQRDDDTPRLIEQAGAGVVGDAVADLVEQLLERGRGDLLG